MRIIKFAAIAVCAGLLLTGCGAEEADDNTKALSCTLSAEFLSEENSVEIMFEEDKIVSSEMSFGSNTGFGQSYADSVCDAYELYEGLTCNATVENPDMDDVYSTYNITVDNETSTKAFLLSKESIDATTYEEFKTALESLDYVCK